MECWSFRLFLIFFLLKFTKFLGYKKFKQQHFQPIFDAVGCFSILLGCIDWDHKL